jgi:quercetin dioxygenase-like cupin family protein
MRNRRSRHLVASILIMSSAALAQPPAEQHAGGRNAGEMKFAPVQNLPTCVEGAVQVGDPAKEPFVIVLRAKAGCVVPWHWHSASERVMVVSGTLRMEMKDSPKVLALEAGGFANLPAKHQHQARCEKTCTAFIQSDGKFDIHYVDKAGQEITPEQALKPHNEQVATAAGATK